MSEGRDLVWDAAWSVAERLNRRSSAVGLEVSACRRRSWRRLQVVEGLWCGDNWTDVFEPFRVRRMFTSRWRDLQSVPSAASNIGTFLRERPDLASLRQR